MSGVIAPAAGVVRRRPIWLFASPVAKRYQYQRSDARPSTSMCTLYDNSGAAVARPVLMIFLNASSSATSQVTVTRALSIPPSGSSGRGASRVQSVPPVGVGSPEATPSVNGSSTKRGRCVTRQIFGTAAHSAAVRETSTRKSRRSIMETVCRQECVAGEGSRCGS